ncbi:MAG: tetratricopeptide repeat protein [Bdellovibrionales bacterium]|nr:tetratricopeptide repeat protein [Bdellovibrionales bacterium]
MWRTWIRNETLHQRLLAVALVFAVALAFAPVSGFQFIQLDDPKHIVENPNLNPPALIKLPAIWKDSYFGMYIPVTYTLWGLTAIFTNIGRYPAVYDPKLYHSLNAIVHLVNVLLLFSILLALSRSTLAAFFGSLFFAWHPVQIESVAWVSSLKDLLCTTFSLLCLSFLLRWESTKCTRWKYYFIGLLSFTLALLSKPSAVMVPVCAAGVLWLFRSTPKKTLAIRLGPWLLLAAPIAYVTKVAQPYTAGLQIAPWWQRPYIALDALGFYVSKLLLPIRLSMDYGRTPHWVLSHLSPYVFVLLVFVAAVIYYREHLGPIPRALLLALLALLPVLGFVPFLFQIFSTVADRYLYFPLALLSIGLTLFLKNQRSRSIWALGGCAIVALGALSREHLPTWQDGIRIFEHSVRITPQSVLASNNLGVEYQVRGRFKEAAESFSRAVELDPKRYDLYGNLGAALVASGNTREGIKKLLFAESNGALPSIVLYNLGRAYLRLGQYENARKYAAEALELEPDTPRVQELYRVTHKSGG